MSEQKEEQKIEKEEEPTTKKHEDYCVWCHKDLLHVNLCDNCRKEIENHNPPFNECKIMECGMCALKVCPLVDVFHLHHDGCPSCCLVDTTKIKQNPLALTNWIQT